MSDIPSSVPDKTMQPVSPLGSRNNYAIISIIAGLYATVSSPPVVSLFRLSDHFQLNYILAVAAAGIAISYGRAALARTTLYHPSQAYHGLALAGLILGSVVALVIVSLLILSAPYPFRIFGI